MEKRLFQFKLRSIFWATFWLAVWIGSVFSLAPFEFTTDGENLLGLAIIFLAIGSPLIVVGILYWYRLRLRELRVWAIPYAALLFWILPWQDMPPSDDIIGDAYGSAIRLTIQCLAVPGITAAWIILFMAAKSSSRWWVRNASRESS
jgi:hypothetical protein